ncbi:alpha/beta hydrolase fold domain-containing protein [Klenkia sp. LSe6-5]|uniref:Alpha/beta hydrolase fold domain-containing protein n=1 Tax=Klenkia sesuvii TaxID=3103137 RepID=A0ABU8DT35_9ACTN
MQTTDHDVVVIGAGFSGLYAVHKFRDQLGMTVAGFEAAEGVGGTWWWNRYPGARCDIESVHYSYSFSDDIQREWHWSERYARQDELLRYLEWVADRLDLRRSFRFAVRVTSLQWEEDAAHWRISTDDGATTTARYVLSGVGGLSKPKVPDFPGVDTFEGELYWTSSWPAEDVDLTGKRVAVVGTGASGIQVIQEIADKVGHLTVFQRTPNYATPLKNHSVAPERSKWLAHNWHEARGNSFASPIGLPYPPQAPSAAAVPADERRRILDEAWDKGGLYLVNTFGDMMWNPETNEVTAQYIRDRIAERVDDPATARLLTPTDHHYATKRPPFETNYYEAFNLDQVDLVDVRSAPIRAVTPTGITAGDVHHDVDVIILATGFDVFTGASLAIPTTGRGGVTLQQKWSGGPRNYLGVQISGFPNLFNIIGPLSIVALYNTPLLIEAQVDFAADAMLEVRDRGARTIDATPQAEQRWVDLVNGVFPISLWSTATNSWFTGANIADKPQGAYVLPIGGPLYWSMYEQTKANGWAGFAIDDQVTPPPPLVRLDPAAALVLANMLNSGFRPLEEYSVEEVRALNEGGVALQASAGGVRTLEPEGTRLRLYVPDRTGSLPIVVFAHGGGFVAGSVDSVDPLCRDLADRLGAVVASVDYRLAPEHPCPSAVEDVTDALRWVRDHGAEFGGDPERVCVMGESAGATLAAVAAQRARDLAIPLRAQVLVYPAIAPGADTDSSREFADGPFLTTAAGRKFWDMYLGAEPAPELASPREGDLHGLAPALVLTVELDPVRDEAEQYGELLRAAGVEVQTTRFDGLFHGTFVMTALVPRAVEMHESVREFLVPRFATEHTPA